MSRLAPVSRQAPVSRLSVAAFWGEEATLPAVTPPGHPCHTGSAEGTPRDLSHRERGGDIPEMLLSRRDLCTSLNSLEFLGNCILAQRCQTGDCGNKTHKPWETVASRKDKKRKRQKIRRTRWSHRDLYSLVLFFGFNLVMKAISK